MRRDRRDSLDDFIDSSSSSDSGSGDLGDSMSNGVEKNIKFSPEEDYQKILEEFRKYLARRARKNIDNMISSEILNFKVPETVKRLYQLLSLKEKRLVKQVLINSIIAIAERRIDQKIEVNQANINMNLMLFQVEDSDDDIPQLKLRRLEEQVKIYKQELKELVEVLNKYKAKIKKLESEKVEVTEREKIKYTLNELKEIYKRLRYVTSVDDTRKIVEKRIQTLSKKLYKSL